MSLVGKVAIVTGGARGIGKGIVLTLAKQGAKVFFNYVSESSKAVSEGLVKEVNELGSEAAFVQADVASPDAPEKIVSGALKAFGVSKLDILVNNAGLGGNASVEDITMSDYDRLMNVNVRAVLFITQAFLPYVNPGGRIVNLSSVSARGGYANQSVYAATKAAVEGLTRVWAFELGPKYKITVNAVNPGPVATQMYYDSGEVHLARMEENNKKTPAAPRAGTENDVAEIVLFLCEERSRWVTGDVWSRLIGGAGVPTPQAAVHESPKQRLQRFKRVYNTVLQICNRPQLLAAPGKSAEQLYASLQRLSTILREESRTAEEHPCLEFVASSQIYSVIARVAPAAHDDRITGAAIGMFGALVDSEEDDFVDASPFARSLMRFADRILDPGGDVTGSAIEADIIEVLFGIAAKIRLQPEILPVWFTSSIRAENDGSRVSMKGNFAGATHKEDFPLVYILLDRIHNEGRVGDFARTGLLYVFEIATNSLSLEEWIVQSDLPTLMASGLGALYSQLSRELSIAQEAHDLPVVLALSDYAAYQHSTSTENVRSESFQSHMRTFLSHLTFWQDVLEHCQSPDVRQSLIDHFRVLFLQQLLYPSLLQSSDTDGGSSVAVLTYLTNMLDALNSPELIDLTLKYLLALPDAPHPRQGSAQRPDNDRRSSLLHNLSRNVRDEPLDPALFNLVDLLLSGLQSSSTPTLFSALKLSTSILSRHHKYACPPLIQTAESDGGACGRTIGALQAETTSLLHLATELGGIDGMNESYAAACDDVRLALECQVLEPMEDKQEADESGPPISSIGSVGQGQSLILCSNDRFLKMTTDLLKSFLSNSVELNLALTEALISLATCATVSLEGWLAVLPAKYQFPDAANGDNNLPALSGLVYMDEEERAALRALHAAKRQPTWAASATASIPAVLQSLGTDIHTLQNRFPDFRNMLAKRKLILGADHDAVQPTAHGSRSPPAQRTQLQTPAQTIPRPVSSPDRSLSTVRSRGGSDRSPVQNAGSPPGSIESRFRQALASPPQSGAGVSKLYAEGSGSLGARPRARGRETESEVLKTRIAFPLAAAGSGSTDEGGDEDAGMEEGRVVSLSHVLTNVIVLQEFILELVAVMQLRAQIFEEVRFV